MEEKYIDLLLTKCLNFNLSKILFISYDIINKDFANKIITKSKTIGVEKIIEDVSDINITKQKLLTLSKEEITNDPYFNKSNWDKYAKLNASFLMLETEFPNALNEVDEEKIALSGQIKRKTRPIFRQKEAKNEISWTIAAIPNKYWADDIYPNKTNSLELLTNAIYKMCMIDTPNPILSWNHYLEKTKSITEKLNNLHIKSLTYKNSLGTNLTVTYHNDTIWSSIADDLKYNMIVNMPSYEIFTSPNYLGTQGIVYSSKPLIYNGALIDKFYLEFKDGKVIKFDAKKGKKTLESIINTDNNSCYLGETALVNYDSPISNTNLVYKTTLIDENASCHLALGAGFPSAIKNGNFLTEEELYEQGINNSTTHVDFMIGTKDLSITATTGMGEIPIFKDGNFVI